MYENLFECEHPAIKMFEGWDNAEQMLDFLQVKLNTKGFGTIERVLECRQDVGTHNTPIFSGIFKCTLGYAVVRCVHRKCTRKEPHWAVYVKRK